MPQVLLTPRARLDLLEIWNYVAEDSFQAADRVVDAISNTCELLATNPKMGRLREELLPDLRSFPAGRHLVFYRAKEDGIEVIRVLHGARDIKSVFERETER